MEVNSRCRFGCSIYFGANDYQLKHYEYGIISVALNWTLSDITALSVRERKHWMLVSERKLGLKDGETPEARKQ